MAVPTVYTVVVRSKWMKLNARALQYFWLVGVTTLVFTLSVLAWWNASPEPLFGSLQVEERESVFFVVQALELEYPHQKQAIRKVRQRLENDADGILIDNSSTQVPLVREHDAKWIFAAAFFSADPVTQRNAVLQLALQQELAAVSEAQ